MKIAILITVSLLTLPSVSVALSHDAAERIATHFGKLPQPKNTSSDFERWAWSTMLFTSNECWSLSKSPQQRPDILNQRPVISGTFRSHNTEIVEKTCAALDKEGFNPQCVAIAHALSDSISRDASLPKEYVQVGANWREAKITGGLYCTLTSYQGGFQFFGVNEFQTTWVSEPNFKIFNTARGPQTLKAGTLLLKVNAPGMDKKPFSAPVTAIVHPSPSTKLP